jgi:hypothetical protein
MVGMGRFALHIWRDERAQDTLEMVLIAGAVVVVMIAALYAGFGQVVPQFIGNSCSSIDTGLPAPTPTPGPGQCISP